MQQAYVQKLSQSCLQLHLVPAPASSFRQHIAQAYSVSRRTPRSLLGITQASSAHLSHDTASSQQATVAEQPFVPLTKARKKKKQAHAFIPPAILGSSWQKAGNVAGYFAWAVGAGLAITALDIDIADVALASAAIAAGVTALGPGADQKAPHTDEGAPQPPSGAIAFGKTATNNVTAAINKVLQVSSHLSDSLSSQGTGGDSAVSPQSATTAESATLARSAAAAESAVTAQPASGLAFDEDVRTRLLVLWNAEREDMFFNPDRLTDAQWAICSKLIETQPSPLSTNEAQLFAKEFQACQRLPGEVMESQHGQVLSLDAAQASVTEATQQSSQQKLNSIVGHAKRRQKQKRKEKKKRRKRH